MRNAYAETLRTYFGRSLASWVSGCFEISGLVLMAVPMALPHTKPFGRLLFCVVLGELILGSSLWVHLRQHLTNPRRAILPGFLRTHLVVFATLSAALVVVYPAVVTVAAGLGSVGLLALVADLFALIGLFVLIASPWVFFALIVGYSVLTLSATHFVMIDTIGVHMASFLTGGFEPLALGLLAVGIAGSGAIVVRLSQFREEDAAYHRLNPYKNWRLRPQITAELSQGGRHGQSQLPSWLRGKRLAPIAAGAGLWPRACRRTGLGSPSAWFRYVPIIMGAIVLLSAGLRPLIRTLAIPTLNLSLMFNLLLWQPSLSISLGWLKQWPFIELEILHPIERASFLKELGLAAALQFALYWCIESAFMLGAFIAISAPSIDFVLAAKVLAAALALHIFAFGLVVWFMRYRSTTGLILNIASIVVAGSLIMPLMLAPRLADARNAVLLAAWMLAALGIWLARDAYQRWLLTELG